MGETIGRVILPMTEGGSRQLFGKLLCEPKHVGPLIQGYEVSTVIGSDHPMVRSRKTGHYYELPWADIIKLAVAAGIDNTEPTPKAGHGDGDRCDHCGRDDYLLPCPRCGAHVCDACQPGGAGTLCQDCQEEGEDR